MNLLVANWNISNNFGMFSQAYQLNMNGYIFSINFELTTFNNKFQSREKSSFIISNLISPLRFLRQFFFFRWLFFATQISWKIVFGIDEVDT